MRNYGYSASEMRAQIRESYCDFDKKELSSSELDFLLGFVGIPYEDAEKKLEKAEECGKIPLMASHAFLSIKEILEAPEMAVFQYELTHELFALSPSDFEENYFNYDMLNNDELDDIIKRFWLEASCGALDAMVLLNDMLGFSTDDRAEKINLAKSLGEDMNYEMADKIRKQLYFERQVVIKKAEL